jgi:hypothetical protein
VKAADVLGIPETEVVNKYIISPILGDSNKDNS